LRRQEAWIDLADRLRLSRANVVAACVFLNMGRSPAWVAKNLHIALVDVEAVSSASKPLLRQSRRQSKPDGDPVCAYCGSTREITQDHKIPTSRGGDKGVRNRVWACRNCNSAKGDRTPEEWLGEG
jgi:5-methylcytosine-specific restriction endonuclease McrA